MAATVSVTQYDKHRRTEECVCFETRVLPLVSKATGVLGTNMHGMESGGDIKNEI